MKKDEYRSALSQMVDESQGDGDDMAKHICCPCCKCDCERCS